MTNAIVSGAPAEPDHDCPRCPRLVEFRTRWRKLEPKWFNGPVPSFGPREARLLVAGLAPGLRGANRTGRPFTGDYAGDLLYETLQHYGFAAGRYEARPDDGLILLDCRITNAVRCVPPENKPSGLEIANCREFLRNIIAEMVQLRAILALGRIAHDSVLASLGVRGSAAGFGHGRIHPIGDLRLYDSFHCSRLNTNTGRLTREMFGAVFAEIRAQLDEPA